jgi:hypothetical protein
MRYWSFYELDSSLETVSEDKIIKLYWNYWCDRMREVGKEDQITVKNCIEDWAAVYWAWETDKNGEPLTNNC